MPRSIPVLLAGFCLALLHAVAARAADSIFASDFETTSIAIGEALAAADGPVSIPVSGAIVTFVKPQVDVEPAGFFIQGQHAGPALYVAVDPATTTPPAKAGDRVAFTITQMATLGSMRRAAAIDAFSRQAENVPLAGLVQDLSVASDVVTSLDDYESELVSLGGSIAAAPVSAGSGFARAQITTAGIPAAQDLYLRGPQTLFDALGLRMGCTFTTGPVPMWRFDTQAQPSVFATADFQDLACAQPTVTGAVALSSTSVRVTFDRAIDPASISGDGSQFTFDGGLVATAASASSNTVTVTTTTQSAVATYTVTVAGSVKDVLGAGVDPALDSATFAGFVIHAELLINEINPNITSSRDLIELLVTQAGSTAGMSLHEIGSSDVLLATLPNIQAAAGDLIVVHQNPDSATTCLTSETTSKSQCPASMYSANYDGAWDVLGEAVGLANSNRVVEIRDASSAIVDAVPFVVSTSPSPPAAFPSNVQQLQAAGWWFPADCAGVPCTYASAPTVVQISVDYLGAGTAATGNSVQRKPGLNTHQATDWNAAAAQTFGVGN